MYEGDELQSRQRGIQSGIVNSCFQASNILHTNAVHFFYYCAFASPRALIAVNIL